MLDRYRMQRLAMRYTQSESVPGDYFEFGTRTGRSLVYAYTSAKKVGCLDGMRFHVFDSFEGFPEPQGLDRIIMRFRKGEALGRLEDFERNLRRNRVERSVVTVIKGWYSDTLNEATRTRLNASGAKVVNIDCDLYESAIAALRFVTPYVQSGTVILFDDYYCFKGDPELGERRAVREWLEENPHIRLTDWIGYETVGKSFIANVR